MEPLDPELQSLALAERGEAEPSAGDRERVARSLSRRVGAGFALGVGLLSSPAAGAAAVSASSAILVKLGAAVAVVGTIAALTIPRWSAPAGSPAETGPVPSAIQTLPAAPAPRVEVAPPSVEAPSPAEAEAPKADASSQKAALPPLAEEARLLKQAQQALRDGKPARALTALAEHQRRFPRGQLTLERSAARVQALCGLGQRGQAEREAKAFLRQHSGSGLATQVRASCGLAESSP